MSLHFWCFLGYCVHGLAVWPSLNYCRIALDDRPTGSYWSRGNSINIFMFGSHVQAWVWALDKQPKHSHKPLPSRTLCFRSMLKVAECMKQVHPAAFICTTCYEKPQGPRSEVAFHFIAIICLGYNQIYLLRLFGFILFSCGFTGVYIFNHTYFIAIHLLLWQTCLHTVEFCLCWSFESGKQNTTETL